MLTTSARLLRLLALLQARRDWSGPELARRLDVSPRTVRNDVARLRSLGYPVQANTGVTGGYRLGAGGALPPLLLDDEEAVAVAVGLRSAAIGDLGGAEEASLRALAKLEQVLPSRLRARVAALAGAVSIAGADRPVDVDVLTAVARAIWTRERLRFDYTDHDGAPSRRDTEPHQMVHTGRRWYLAAWDVERAGWRTFRVDRMTPTTPTGPRFAFREPPGGDFVDHVTRGAAAALWRYRARIRLHASLAAISERLPPTAGSLEALDDEHCVLSTGADSWSMLVFHLGLLDVDFDVLDPPELREHVHRLGLRHLRAASGP